jgi:hypothetical protein
VSLKSQIEKLKAKGKFVSLNFTATNDEKPKKKLGKYTLPSLNQVSKVAAKRKIRNLQGINQSAKKGKLPYL